MERKANQRFERFFYHWNGSSAGMRIESDRCETAKELSIRHYLQRNWQRSNQVAVIEEIRETSCMFWSTGITERALHPGNTPHSFFSLPRLAGFRREISRVSISCWMMVPTRPVNELCPRNLGVLLNTRSADSFIYIDSGDRKAEGK